MLKLTQWHIDPPAQSPVTIPLAGDVHPPIVRMLVPRNTDPPLKVFHIERGLVTVGRDPQCDLPINDESISRKHAEISKAEGRWVVKDLDSKNGTFVSFNGDPHTERRIESINALKNGSIVRFGQVSFTIILED
jgi:pSer/pThr/pTyr-binding forkhead associated (FHA) protein